MVTSAICSSCSFGVAIGTERQRPVNKCFCCSRAFIRRHRCCSQIPTRHDRSLVGSERLETAPQGPLPCRGSSLPRPESGQTFLLCRRGSWCVLLFPLCAPDQLQVAIHCIGEFPTEREQGIAVRDGVGPRAKADLDLFAFDSAYDNDPDVFLFGSDGFNDFHGVPLSE